MKYYGRRRANGWNSDELDVWRREWLVDRATGGRVYQESAAQSDNQAANSSIRALHMAKMRQEARQCLSFKIAKDLQRNIPGQRANSHAP